MNHYDFTRKSSLFKGKDRNCVNAEAGAEPGQKTIRMAHLQSASGRRTGQFSCIGNPLAAGMEQKACVILIRFNDREIRKVGRCFLP